MPSRKSKKGNSGFFRNANVTDFLVVIVIFNIMAFSGIALYFYYMEGTPPPDNLMGYFYAFFGTELLAMAGIQVSKHRRDREE